MKFNARQRANIELRLIVQRNGHRVRTHPVEIDMGGVSVLVAEPEHFIIEETVDIEFICKASDQPLVSGLSARVAHVRGEEVVLDFVDHNLDSLEQVIQACRKNARVSTKRGGGLTAIFIGLIVISLLMWAWLGRESVNLTNKEVSARDNLAKVDDFVPISTQKSIVNLPLLVAELRAEQVEKPVSLSTEQSAISAAPVRGLLVSVVNHQGRVIRVNWALVLNKPATAVVPMALLKQASGAWLDMPHGVRVSVNQVIAADPVSGLALLKIPDNEVLGTDLSDEDHGLYLGRDIRVWGLLGTVPGTVSDSEREYPEAVVARQTTAMTMTGDVVSGGVISARDSDQIIGLVVDVDDGGREVQAVDIGAVTRLLATVSSSQALSVSEFSRKYFEETPAGRWEQVLRLMDERAYSKALQLLEALYDEGWQDRRTLQPSLMELYQVLINDAFAHRRTNTVRQLFERASRRLGADPSLTQLKLSLALRDPDPRVAYEELTQLRQQVGDAGIDIDTVRRIVRLLVLDRMKAGRLISAVDLLGAEMARDVPFAPYFSLYGRLLMQLSEYTDAVQAMRQAIDLDSALERDLGPLVEEALSWGDTPKRSEVQFEKLHGVIVTEVRINGSSQVFKMVVDTGASLTVLTPEALKRLGLEGATKGTSTLLTAGGNVQAALIQLDHVQVGSAERSGVLAAVTSLGQGIDGLLGLSFLNGFEVTVKSDQNKLILTRQ